MCVDVCGFRGGCVFGVNFVVWDFGAFVGVFEFYVLFSRFNEIRIFLEEDGG